MSDLIVTSACQLAQMIRDREVSVVEVLDAHLEQIARFFCSSQASELRLCNASVTLIAKNHYRNDLLSKID